MGKLFYGLGAHKLWSLREITRRELSAVTVRGGRNWFMGLLNANTKAKRGSVSEMAYAPQQLSAVVVR